MKYANSLKYVNSFEKAESLSELSQKRIKELCAALGKVNVGSRFIVTSGCSAGHATAVMMESVIKNAGYKVGRITSDASFDSRLTAFVDGEIAKIEDYNKCVAEIKSVVSKNANEKYYRCEIVFALSLLLCKLAGCEFVILEGLSDENYSIDALCAPFDLVIFPTVYCGENDACVKTACDAIKRGVREVVSGNQKNTVYNAISNACMISGVRLNVTAKPTLTVSNKTARRVEFSYAERGGYVLKSPSAILRDCAMLVIESALALRRDGVKMPWGSIAAGLERSSNAECFDIVSVSPAVIVDSASAPEEISSMIATFEETVEPICNLTVCVSSDSAQTLESQLKAFENVKIEKIIICGMTDKIELDNALPCTSVPDAAKNVYEASKNNKTVLCFGSVAFAREIKAEFIKLMGL